MGYIIKGNTGEWEVVIGLEVHAQVTSKSKLFSSAPTTFGADPNTNVSFVDAAMPGMLPVLNEYCVEQAIRTGLGLRAQINLQSVFDRKNYFYADLPQGYQISQFAQPIVGEGELILDMPDGHTSRIGIERIHLEQDAGKSMHDQSPESSFIDLNRSGIALMEIVSKPDMRSPEEAAEYMKKLRAIVRYLHTCDGDMEKGSMRCDANVSVRPKGDTELRTRCEIKNLNSVRFLQQAIIFEANRHVEAYESGQTIAQETRLFDSNKCETRTMRTKEDAHDYRYFPDPDLLPLNLTQEFVDRIKASLPELPDDKKQRYIEKLGLTPYDASVIVSDKETSVFFEEVAAHNDPKLSANWITAELFGRLNKLGLNIIDSPVTAKKFSGLLALITDNTISGKIAKDVLDDMISSGQDAAQIVEAKGLKQVTDTGAIEKVIDEVLAANPDKLAEYRSGKDKLFGFFVGQVMKASGGKANPNAVNDILKAKLAG
jgi:aspartyl-tRNA(Asn)/glutamyl-tRNA(Gln) amidotransferase subunit B